MQSLDCWLPFSPSHVHPHWEFELFDLNNWSFVNNSWWIPQRGQFQVLPGLPNSCQRLSKARKDPPLSTCASKTVSGGSHWVPKAQWPFQWLNWFLRRKSAYSGAQKKLWTSGKWAPAKGTRHLILRVISKKTYNFGVYLPHSFCWIVKSLFYHGLTGIVRIIIDFRPWDSSQADIAYIIIACSIVRK